jgi:DNA repair photolyase
MTQLIYQPKGKAGEYAEWALNHYTGCDHRCTYCYAPAILKMSREEFSQVKPRWDDERFFAQLDREAAGMAAKGLTPQVLLSFTTDPYCNLDVEVGRTRRVIELLHRHGISVCTLTKGGTRALRDLDLFTPEDAFATTLTFTYDNTSQQYEPGADMPTGRLQTLRRYHEEGVTTWVSLEPVFDVVSTLWLIEQSAPFVDLFKVGTLNYHPHARNIDWCRFGHQAVSLLESLGKAYMIKADLRAKMGVMHG